MHVAARRVAAGVAVMHSPARVMLRLLLSASLAVRMQAGGQLLRRLHRAPGQRDEQRGEEGPHGDPADEQHHKRCDCGHRTVQEARLRPQPAACAAAGPGHREVEAPLGRRERQGRPAGRRPAQMLHPAAGSSHEPRCERGASEAHRRCTARRGGGGAQRNLTRVACRNQGGGLSQRSLHAGLHRRPGIHRVAQGKQAGGQEQRQGDARQEQAEGCRPAPAAHHTLMLAWRHCHAGGVVLPGACRRCHVLA